MKSIDHSKRTLFAALFAIIGSATLHTPAVAEELKAKAAPESENEKADDSDDAILKLGKAAESFVSAFNDRDAPAIAALFLPQGEIRSRDGTTLSGKEEIEEFYTELFAGESVPGVSLEATSVHFLTPDMAIEEGVLHFTNEEDEAVRTISYSAIQVRQSDGSWLTAVSRDKQEVTPPSEQIKPLHWLIGEWTLEGEEGVRVDMVIQLDERENYLIGEALITNSDGDAQSSNLRIGWNPATSSIYWWNFDSEGGHSSGRWTRSENQWQIHNSGVTAENEATSSIQTLSREGVDGMEWQVTRRTVAGEALDDIDLSFVRRAPEPAAKKTEEDP